MKKNIVKLGTVGTSGMLVVKRTKAALAEMIPMYGSENARYVTTALTRPQRTKPRRATRSELPRETPNVLLGSSSKMRGR